MKNQLTFFPTPYEDEDFKSLVYRYHIRSTNINILETIEELFNIKTHRVAHFPNNLDCLVEKLPSNHFLTSDYLITNHSLIALFLPFLSVKESEKILWRFRCTKDSSDIGSRMLSPIVSSLVRYCPTCLVEDFEKFGESYIHRVHQYKFVNVCSVHRLNLVTNCPKCGVALSDCNGRFILNEPLCPGGHYLGDYTRVEPPTRVQLFNEQLARDTKFIIDNVAKLNVELFKERMQGLCSNKEYLASQGMFLNKKFSKDFLRLFNEEILMMVGLDTSYLSTRTALKLLNFDGRLKNPLLYILGMEYLGQSVENFVSSDAVISNFGTGPWLCKNNYCPDFNRLVIHQYKRRSIEATQSIIGEFTCPCCGMIYSQTVAEFLGYEQGQKKIISIGWRVAAIILESYLNNVEPDHIFEELKVKPRQRKMIEQKANYTIESSKKRALLEVLDKSRHAKSIKEVINSPGISIHFADFLSKPIGWMYGDKAISRLERDKTILLECIQNSCDRESIKHKVGESTYNRMMKRDPKWMDSVLPPREFHFKSLDWEHIDKELEVTLIQIANEIYFFPPKTRVQKYTLLNKLNVRDKARIVRFPERLPIAIKLLERSIETIESYQIRKIPDIIEQVRKSTWALTLDNVLKTPILRGCSNIVKEKTFHELMRQTKNSG